MEENNIIEEVQDYDIVNPEENASSGLGTGAAALIGAGAMVAVGAVVGLAKKAYNAYKKKKELRLISEDEDYPEVNDEEK